MSIQVIATAFSGISTIIAILALLWAVSKVNHISAKDVDSDLKSVTAHLTDYRRIEDCNENKEKMRSSLKGVDRNLREYVRDVDTRVRDINVKVDAQVQVLSDIREDVGFIRGKITTDT